MFPPCLQQLKGTDVEQMDHIVFPVWHTDVSDAVAKLWLTDRMFLPDHGTGMPSLQHNNGVRLLCKGMCMTHVYS